LAGFRRPGKLACFSRGLKTGQNWQHLSELQRTIDFTLLRTLALRKQDLFSGFSCLLFPSQNEKMAAGRDSVEP
jgi:hypothetical protein